MQDLLGDLHEDLAEAADETGLVTAVARYAERHHPQALRLFYLHYDEQPTPVAAELVASWDSQGSGQAPATLPRFSLTHFTLVQLGMADPDHACVIPDIAADPRISEREKQLCAAAGHASLVILPCYSRSSRTWQGVMSLLWPTVRTPGAEELFVYNLIARMSTAFIASRRAKLAHKETLLELKLINEVIVRLSAAQSLAQALQAVAQPFIDRGARTAMWSTLYTSPEGHPSEVEIIASWERVASAGPSWIGQRIPVTAIPLSTLWVADPDQPLLVSEVTTDERIEPAARALLAERQRIALIVLPMRTRGRWVGTIWLTWNEAQPFTRQDHTLCKSLISQAAIVFDNLQLMDRMQSTVREHQRQTLALRALLDNMPVGVAVFAQPSGKSEVFNPKALQILGAELATVPDRQTFGQVFKLYAPGGQQPLALTEVPLGQTLVDGQPHHSEIEILRPDGTRVGLDVFSAPIFDESGVMRSAMSLFVDISGRKRAESERVRIQEELIAFQAAALAERSTPLIPISDEIIVLPLIGSLDTARGEQVLDVLLHGVSQTRTRVALIDVTGVRTLDTQAAQTLTQAAQALRLLGVEPVLTGIRAEVAQTLVRLGVPLAGIATHSTLQSGIAYANRKKSR